jgi:hypothetical protein
MSLTSQNDDHDMNWNNIGSVILRYGITGVLALYLVYWTTGRADQKLVNVETAALRHQNETQELRIEIQNLKYEASYTNSILQQICVNGAALRDRPNCFRRPDQ